MVPGTAVRVPAGTKHWHGAKVGSWFSHLAFITPGEGVSNEWLEPVTGGVRPVAEERRERVSVPQLCIRYTLQPATVSLPKTADPQHMRSDARVDFAISDDDMAALEDLRAQDHGDSSVFPVFSGK
ncbi:hypothetical protein [Brachybacterium hainanense]|uniref:Cupin type-1 domain-containing protein n=1 Tax=Brachybacterium hainanense TaxID=1541174 RepID=A0ABV6RDX5_9MICO